MNKANIINVNSLAKYPKWKVHLWEKNSIEPAMLRVPLVIIVFIILWGITIWILDRTKVDYVFVLPKSAQYSFIFSSAIFLSLQYAFNMTIFSTSFGLTIETSISCFYLFLFVIFMLPNIPFADTRNNFLRLLRLVFIPSYSSVSFPEILLADALTSISKVFKDFGITIVVLYAYANRLHAVEYHDQAMILIALLASLPFCLRIKQCYIQLLLYNGSDIVSRIPILLNIIKYISSLPPIWLTAGASIGYTLPNTPLIIAIAAVINSLYSFLWDVIMDWGLISYCNREGRVVLLFRQRMLLPYYSYILVVIINLLLRFSWTVNRIPGMDQLHSSVIILIIELGEVCRRAIWSIFRIEWEVIVRQDKLSNEKQEIG